MAQYIAKVMGVFAETTRLVLLLRRETAWAGHVPFLAFGRMSVPSKAVGTRHRPRSGPFVWVRLVSASWWERNAISLRVCVQSTARSGITRAPLLHDVRDPLDDPSDCQSYSFSIEPASMVLVHSCCCVVPTTVLIVR